MDDTQQSELARAAGEGIPPGGCRVASEQKPDTRPFRPRPSRTSVLGSPNEREEARSEMEIEFLSTVAVITPDPPASRKLYVGALGLPLESRGDDEYHHSEQISGC